MIISSRTPEGEPNRCIMCGKRIRIAPSESSRDAPCPKCGHLNWWEHKPNIAVDPLDVSLGSFDLVMSLPTIDQQLDSPTSIDEHLDSKIDLPEVAPALEKDFNLSIPDEAATDIHSLGELVAYFERMGGGS